MRISLFISLLPIFLLIACGNDSSEPPSLDRTDTIGGVDADKNGIRDDIDIVIDKLSADRKPDISRYVQQVTRDMIIGLRGVSSASSEKKFTTVVYPTISAVEEKIYLELVINTAARKAAFATWQGI